MRYRCEYCRYSSNDLGAVTRHMIRHTNGGKPTVFSGLTGSDSADKKPATEQKEQE